MTADLTWPMYRQYVMYRQFFSVNKGNAIKMFDAGVEGDAGGALETYNYFFGLTYVPFF